MLATWCIFNIRNAGCVWLDRLQSRSGSDWKYLTYRDDQNHNCPDRPSESEGVYTVTAALRPNEVKVKCYSLLIPFFFFGAVTGFSVSDKLNLMWLNEITLVDLNIQHRRPWVFTVVHHTIKNCNRILNAQSEAFLPRTTFNRVPFGVIQSQPEVQFFSSQLVHT